MKFAELKPPRSFPVGMRKGQFLYDCGKIYLNDDEQITFMSGSKEYDVVKKNWGFYATPSLNGRLCHFGFMSCIAKNLKTERIFALLVEEGKTAEFEDYLEKESMAVVAWLHEGDVQKIIDD
jgi:hypothetical protein